MSKHTRIGKRFAARIKRAVADDQTIMKLGLAPRGSDEAFPNLRRAIIKIGDEMETLTDEDLPLTEEAAEVIFKATTNELGWPKPKTLRKMTRSGSVDALLTMAQQLESLFKVVKK